MWKREEKLLTVPTHGMRLSWKWKFILWSESTPCSLVTWVATLPCSSKHRSEEPSKLAEVVTLSDFRLRRFRFEFGTGHRLTGRARFSSVISANAGIVATLHQATNASFSILCNAGQTYGSNTAPCLREGSHRSLVATRWIIICWGIR